MVCKKCGSQIKSDFKYCPYCGERIISDFHDQYTGLTPPYVIHEPEKVDVTAEFYVEDPDEQEPNFDLPSHGWENGVNSEEPDFTIPEEELKFPTDFEDPYIPPNTAAEEDESGTPYYVFRNSVGGQSPDWRESISGRFQEEELESPPGFQTPVEHQQKGRPSHPQKGPAGSLTIWMKLLLIFGILLLAAIVSIFGFQMLKPTADGPTQKEDAVLTSVIMDMSPVYPM